MRMPVRSTQIGPKVLEALGLSDRSVRDLIIIFKTNDVVLIETVEFATEEQIQKLIPILKEYELVEKTKPNTN